MHLKAPLIAAATIAASVSVAFAEETETDAVDPRIGEEVSQICFVRSIDNWRGIKGEDDVILLEKGVNDWYRVELFGFCNSFDIRTADFIALDTFGASSCLSRGDTIILKEFGGSGFDDRCRISRIYEWNEDAEAEAAEKEDAEIEAEAETGAEEDA